ncbi:dTDP-4-dehydrorhamnose 3,5-epimerase [Leeuwenhoekiella sp. W20_SRS_FM14]|uniref:dTDP-4-dehydrorhamnose 3,5-epimerase n=1 Tax=Leeuwenhoekiella sp. W20_SRS_FM14 TaxID=3240270 RepID=UPI003F97D3E9
MQFIETGFKDLWLMEPKVFGDSRGYFFEAFNANTFLEHTGLKPNFVQQNQSKSQKNVLRGLHLQTGDYSQAKLIRVIQGSVLDVVVDLRKEEPTFGKSYAIELNESNQRQLFVPRNFAHGFLVLEEDTLFTYSCDNYYNPQFELTLKFDDPNFINNWPENIAFNLSDKDTKGLDFQSVIDRMYV